MIPIMFLKKIFTSKPMKTVGGVLGGVLGIGGGLGAGLDVEFAVLVGATAAVACFAGIDKAEKFYHIFKERRGDK